jgi:hypothetical protein
MMKKDEKVDWKGEEKEKEVNKHEEGTFFDLLVNQKKENSKIRII